MTALSSCSPAKRDQFLITRSSSKPTTFRPNTSTVSIRFFPRLKCLRGKALPDVSTRVTHSRINQTSTMQPRLEHQRRAISSTGRQENSREGIERRLEIKRQISWTTLNSSYNSSRLLRDWMQLVVRSRRCSGWCQRRVMKQTMLMESTNRLSSTRSQKLRNELSSSIGYSTWTYTVVLSR